MAYTVITRPAELSMSGNIADFVLDSNAPVTFKLAVGGKVILDEIYTPTSAGAITIKLRKVIEQQLTLSIPTSDFFEQSKSVIYFLATIDTIDYGFRVVKGGVDANVLDAATYLSQNFLTWQPQSKQVKLNDPEWLTYFSALYATKVVKAKGYYLDNTTETIVAYTIDEEPKCWTMNVQYALLAGKFTAAPSYIDVWVEDSNGVRLTFIQRYILQADFDEFDDLFVFENSLGGIDTIRYTGTLQEINDPDVASAIFGEETMEFGLDVDRYFSKNTGGFKSERHQQWAVDFFNSYNRYRIADGVVRRIVLRKADIKGVKRDVNSFSFNFAYTKQTNRLNLARFDTLPDVIEMVDPNSELFFLAPRLSEFPTAPLAYNFLFPIQSPYEKKWYKASIYEIANLLTTEGGVGQNALDSEKWNGHRWDDYMEQALKKASDVEFHNAKVNNLQAADTVINSLVSALYQSGFNGNGFKIDADGNAEVKSLMVRDQLTVLELVVQKLRSIGGMIILSSANGKATKVELKENSYYRITLDTTGTLTHSFVIDDLVKCQRFNGGVKSYWRRVVAVGADYIDLAKDSGYGTGIPEDGDELVQFGNTTDTSRQNAIILDATALPRIDIYQGINSYTLDGKLKSRLGDLSEQGIEGMGIFTSQGKFTGQVVIGGGSTGYENFTDKPDLSIYPLKTYVDGAFKDGVISQAEASAIEKYKAQVNAAFNDTIATYNVIYANAYLEGTAKTDLLNAKVTMAGAKDNLIASITNAIFDGKTTVSEKADVDAKYALWDSALSTYKSKLEAANKAIQQKLDAISKGYVDSVQIGGRNYARNTRGIFEASGSQYRFWGDSLPVVSNAAGKTITISCEAMVTATAGNDVQLLLVAFDPSWSVINASVLSTANRTTWEKIETTFVVPEGYNGDILFQAYNYPNGNGGEVAMQFPKFEFGNKATDYTPNPEEIDADISSAQTAANNAAASAAVANNLLADIADDNKISPSEKQQATKEWNVIISEKTKIDAQADIYAVSKTAYATAYSALSSYITPLLANLSTTDPINGAAFRATFKGYYDARQDILNAISTAAKTYADFAVNNIQIGGRNVFRYGQDFDSMSGHMADNGGGMIRDAVVTWNGRPTIKSTGSLGINLLPPVMRIKQNTEYTVSFMALSNTAQTGSADGILHVQSWTVEEVGDYHMEVNIALDVSLEANKWKRVWNTFKTPNSASLAYFGLYLFNFIGTMNIAEIQLEEGNKVSPWRPATEDLDARIAETNYLKEALKNDTSIEGGLVSTTLLKVGAVNQSGEYNENAGINGAGQGSDTPRIYSGGSLQDAVSRVAGNTAKDMAVITDGGKLFASAGEIAGFLMTQNGIEKEKSITEPDSTTFVGKFKLDWVNQIINFLRDGSSRVLISAKKLTSGIPTPTNFTVANGTWQNTIELTRVGLVLSHTSILGPRTLVAPGAYDAKETLSLRAYRGLYADTWLININFQVTLNIWKTDSNNAKISLLSSSTQSVNLYSNTNVALVTAYLTASLSIENETGLSHEVVLTGTMVDPNEMPNINYSKVIYQTSLIYTASQESVEIGYSGLRVIAQNLWFYFNSKDGESKHLRMRGNAELFSKGGNVTMSLTNTSVNPSRLSLQAVMTNLITTSINYTFTDADKNATGIKVINSTYDVLITLPDLNASEVVDGETIYYNNSRLLMVISTNRNCGIAAVSGQTVRGVASVNASTNTGWIFIGDKDRLNWLILGVG